MRQEEKTKKSPASKIQHNDTHWKQIENQGLSRSRDISPVHEMIRAAAGQICASQRNCCGFEPRKLGIDHSVAVVRLLLYVNSVATILQPFFCLNSWYFCNQVHRALGIGSLRILLYFEGILVPLPE